VRRFVWESPHRRGKGATYYAHRQDSNVVTEWPPVVEAMDRTSIADRFRERHNPSRSRENRVQHVRRGRRCGHVVSRAAFVQPGRAQSVTRPAQRDPRRSVAALSFRNCLPHAAASSETPASGQASAPSHTAQDGSDGACRARGGRRLRSAWCTLRRLARRRAWFNHCTLSRGAPPFSRTSSSVSCSTLRRRPTPTCWATRVRAGQ